MIRIDRRRKEWEQSFLYKCKECSSVSESISRIDHKKNCSVSEPDDVCYPFVSSETKELIHNIIREVKWRLESVEFVTDLEPLTDIMGVKWDARGSSSRIVLGLGRTTHKGEFHLEDRRGIVLKIDARARWNKNTPVSGNIDELLTWLKAKETGTESLFGEIITASKDGMWLVMEQCIPVYKSRGSLDENRNSIFDSGGEKYINPLINRLYENNWYDPDYKYGNIGITDSGEVVIIDYGTGPNYVSDE